MFHIPSLPERLHGIAVALGAFIGAYVRRLATPPQPVWIGDRVFIARPEPEPLPRLADELWALFLRRLNRAVHRFHALHRAWSDGTLAPPRPRAARPDSARPESTRPDSAIPDSAIPASAPRLRLPRAHGWVNRRVANSHQCAGLLHALLQESSIAAFVQAVPRAGRHLRPLCVALGVDQPDWLRLPPRPRKPRAPRPRKPRPLSLNDPSLTLRPWVIAAARAWKRQDRKKRRG